MPSKKITCKLCNRKLDSRGYKSHLKFKHSKEKNNAAKLTKKQIKQPVIDGEYQEVAPVDKLSIAEDTIAKLNAQAYLYKEDIRRFETILDTIGALLQLRYRS